MKLARAALLLLCPFGMALFFSNKPNFNLIWSISAFIMTIIATVWFEVKEDTFIDQVENDLIYCMVLQGAPISFETLYLLNMTDEQEEHPLLILFIIVLNLICVFLLDYLINRVKFYKVEDKND
ncbi:hypothetical protein [Lactobacillus sp. ESL0261]|uniref:hypothetical protein n=1 Tax=Lactobacillus sp. ESL0261 TaxID=2069348 RepID=UPI000EFD74B2|nr:hypothetical protein [Lactobacillus sp. ESL0261]RMC56787.1 hypothetical protein F5ESL0261_00750 [Lactobacillus sp. ESL0261]